MHSWIFRRRAELARVYGLAPARALDRRSTPTDLPEVGREILIPARPPRASE